MKAKNLGLDKAASGLHLIFFISSIVLLLFLSVITWASGALDFFMPERRINQVISLLNSRSMFSLVTEEAVTQVVTDIDEHSLLLGRREGILIATVRIQYGINLQNLSRNDITEIDAGYLIRLPAPGIINIDTDYNTLRFFTQQTGLQLISDIFTGNDIQEDLLSLIDPTVQEFVDQNEFAPNRREVEERVEEFLRLLDIEESITIEFYGEA